MARTYDQYCPVAGALDVLGERWNLLVVRELLRGAKRFSDLKGALPGLSPTLLATRLRVLEKAGVLEPRLLPPPAARTVYDLTASGRELQPVVAALARWGMAHRLPPPAGRQVSPRMAWSSAVLAWFDPTFADGIDATFRAVLDGAQLDIAVVDGRLRAPRPGREPDLVLEGSAAALVEARQGVRTLDDALVGVGPPEALAAFSRVFSFRSGVPVPEELDCAHTA